MTNRSTSADFVTAFATGWPEQQPDIMVLSLTTHKGVQDFALTKDQALLIAKTMKELRTKKYKKSLSEMKKEAIKEVVTRILRSCDPKLHAEKVEKTIKTNDAHGRAHRSTDRPKHSDRSNESDDSRRSSSPSDSGGYSIDRRDISSSDGDSDSHVTRIRPVQIDGQGVIS